MADRLRVLVVDHDPIHRLGILRALEQGTLGAEIIEVGTPAEAFQILKTPVDCVLVDQDLPNKGALEVVVQLRGDRNPVPILLITGSPSPAIVTRAAQLGIVKVLEKPPEEADLLNFVGAYL